MMSSIDLHKFADVIFGITSEDEIDFDCNNSGSSQNRPIYRKKLTRKRLVQSIDSSLDESNFEPIVYVNRNRNFYRLSWPKDK